MIRIKKKILHRQLGPLRGSSSPFRCFELAGVRLIPIKLVSTEPK